MSTLIMTAEGNPIFASRNWIGQDSIDYGTFTVTEMDTLIDRLIDGDPFSYWQGSSESDAVTVTMNFDFRKGSVLYSRAFDLVILQNINWKNFIVEYSNDNGATWATVTGLDYTVSNNTATDIITNIAAGLTGHMLRITITTTFASTPNAAKKMGGLIVCQSAVQLSGGFLDYKVKNRETIREIMLADGSLSREIIQRSATSYEFFGASFDCPIVTAAELASLRTIKRVGDPFIFIPEPGVAPYEAYQCYFDGAWGYAYENAVRSVGYAIPMKVKEVGTH